MQNLRSLLEFAVDACQKAGKITLEYFQKDIQIDRKPDHSPVTIADRQSEEKIRELIQRYYPEHAIVGEEFGTTTRASEYTWYVDPIDGTQSFIRGVPIYGVMLGLEIQGDFVLGVVNLPALRELVYAAKGEGCYWNDQKTNVRTTSALEDALLCISGFEYFEECARIEAFHQLQSATQLYRTWGDCYGHILVATGRADLCVDPVLNSWDAVPLIPIIREAGGIFTDWKGEVTPHNREGISTNLNLLPEVLKITSQY